MCVEGDDENVLYVWREGDEQKYCYDRNSICECIVCVEGDV